MNAGIREVFEGRIGVEGIPDTKPAKAEGKERNDLLAAFVLGQVIGRGGKSHGGTLQDECPRRLPHHGRSTSGDEGRNVPAY